MNNRHKLLLFDIDGTLVIYKGKIPHRLFEGMIEEIFNKKISLANYRFSGKTDKAIIDDVCTIAEIPKEEHLAKEEAMMEWVGDRLEQQASPESLHLLPNVPQLLETLSPDRK